MKETKRDWNYVNWYTCDFETQDAINNITSEPRVIATGMQRIGFGQSHHKQNHGWNSIHDFIFDLEKLSNDLIEKRKTNKKVKNSIVIFFHNLKFDLSFLQPALIDHGYLPVLKDGDFEKNKKQWKILASGFSKVFQFTIQMKKIQIIIRDSAKLFPMQLSKLTSLIDKQNLKDKPILQAKGDLNYKRFITYKKGTKKAVLKNVLNDSEWINEAKRFEANFDVKNDLILYNNEKELIKQIGLKDGFVNTNKNKMTWMHNYLFKDCYILSEAIKSFYHIIANLLISNGVHFRGIIGLYKKITIGGIAKYLMIKLGDHFYKKKFPKKYKTSSPYATMFEGIMKKEKKKWVHHSLKEINTFKYEYMGFFGGFTTMERGIRAISSLDENKIPYAIKKAKLHILKPKENYPILSNTNEYDKQVANGTLKYQNLIGVGGAIDKNSSYPSNMAEFLMPMSKKYDETSMKKALKKNSKIKFQKWVLIQFNTVKMKSEYSKRIPAFLPSKRDFYKWKVFEESTTNDNPHFLDTIQPELDKFEKVKLAISQEEFDHYLKYYDIDYNILETYYYHLSDYFQPMIKSIANLKIKAAKEGNSSMKNVIKLIINNIYGKTVENPIKQQMHFFDWKDAKNLYKVIGKNEFKFTYGSELLRMMSLMMLKEEIYNETKSFSKKSYNEKMQKEINRKCINAANKLFLNGNYYQWVILKTTKEFENREFLANPKKLPPIQVGAYITAKARMELVELIDLNSDIFLYTDTDSIYVNDVSKLKGMKIHPTDLCKWSFDDLFYEFKVIKPKCYAYKSYYSDLPVFKVAGKDKNAEATLKVVDDLKVGVKYGQLEPSRSNKGTTLKKKYKYIS